MEGRVGCDQYRSFHCVDGFNGINGLQRHHGSGHGCRARAYRHAGAHRAPDCQGAGWVRGGEHGRRRNSDHVAGTGPGDDGGHRAIVDRLQLHRYRPGLGSIALASGWSANEKGLDEIGAPFGLDGLY